MNIHYLINSSIFIGQKINLLHFSMKNYIIININKISFFNLKKIILSIINLKKKIFLLFKNNENILFVGTNNYFKELVYKYARSTIQPYICSKWISGNLTNSINYKKLLNKIIYKKKVFFTKKEKNIFLKKKNKIEILFGGLRFLKKIKLIFIIDINKNKIAINEAKRKKIKIAVLADSNDNCYGINYIIPCNNKSLFSVKIIFKILFSDLC